MSETPWLDAAGVAMWDLVDRYTGHVGYQGGVKAEGLETDPKVIDCSGWVAFLLRAGMEAANRRSGRTLFNADDVAAVRTWSDKLIQDIEGWSGFVLEGDDIRLGGVPAFATIGLRQGGGAWANNHPRPRGITHVVQVVARPTDGQLFVTEAQGWAQPRGLRLLALADWLNVTQTYLKRGDAWGVNAFVARSGSQRVQAAVGPATIETDRVRTS